MSPKATAAQPKKLTPQSLKELRKYVDRFRRLNIFGDDEIQKMLADFRSEFMGGDETLKAFRGDGVKNTVTAALTKIRSKAANDREQTGKFVNRFKRRAVIWSCTAISSGPGPHSGA